MSRKKSSRKIDITGETKRNYKIQDILKKVVRYPEKTENINNTQTNDFDSTFKTQNNK